MGGEGSEGGSCRDGMVVEIVVSLRVLERIDGTERLKPETRGYLKT